MPHKTKILEFRTIAEGEKIDGETIVDEGLPTEYNNLISIFRENGVSKLLLAWEGSKVPRGIELPNGKIAWTQHGVISGEDGQQLGYYERIEEWGGEDRNRHKMIISIS